MKVCCYHFAIAIKALSYIYTDLPEPIVTIGGHSATIREGTVGEDFNLTCIVTVVEYLTVKPTVKWSAGSVSGVMVGDTTHSGVMSMKTLTFSPLCPSHQMAYICQATINIPLINIQANKYIIIDAFICLFSNFILFSPSAVYISICE